jgi:antirestriction protein ArdC
LVVIGIQAGEDEASECGVGAGKKLGGHVLAGEHGHLLSFFERRYKEENGKQKSYPVHIVHTVFNVEQTSLVEKGKVKPFVVKEHIHTNDEIEAVFTNMPNPPNFRFAGNQACYYPLSDTVELPHIQKFESFNAYISTKAHEYIHSTGIKERLNRDMSGGMRTESYSQEELTAEIGAAMLRRHFNIVDDYEDKMSASYINGWRKRISTDKQIVVKAASRAEKAVRYILNELHDNTEAEITDETPD